MASADKIPAVSDEKKEALKSAFSKIEKKFGQGAIMRLGDTSGLKVDAIPTGSLNLDAALGVGGIPRGKIIEIYGPEASGKTTLALHIIAQAQQLGGIAAFIDAEHALDPRYARALGVDIDNLMISQPDSGEQALEIVEYLIRSGAVDVVVVDSVAALVPRNEIDGDMGDATMGNQARLMSQAMRKLVAVTYQTNSALVFINQLREKVGGYGNPEVTPGGRALKFYSSVRIDVRRLDQIKVSGMAVGNRTRAKVVKNRVAPPFREAEFDIIYGKGISMEGEIIDNAVKYGVVQRSGTWFSYEGNRLGQGRDNVREYLLANPELRSELLAKVRAAIVAPPSEEGAAEPAGGAQAVKKVVKTAAAPKENGKYSIDIDVDDE